MQGPDLIKPYIGRIISSTTAEPDRFDIHFLDGTVLTFEDMGTDEAAEPGKDGAEMPLKEVSERLRNSELLSVTEVKGKKKGDPTGAAIETTGGSILLTGVPRRDAQDPTVHPI